MILKVSDPTGEAWLSVFNEQAEKIIGCSADELERIKTEVLGHLIFRTFTFKLSVTFNL
jgi:Replication factor-A C terminal domain